IAYLLWYSRCAWAMAADGSLPRFLAKLHPRFGTPTRALILYAIGYSILALWPFDELLILNLWVFGAYDLLLVFAAIRARKVYADRPPGFRIPGGTFGLWLNALVPTVTWVVALVSTGRDYVVPGTAALMLAPALYCGRRLLRRQRAAA